MAQKFTKINAYQGFKQYSHPPEFQAKFIFTCNNISATCTSLLAPKATRSNLREPKFKHFLGEHPRPPRSSVPQMTDSFPSLTETPV